jgi:tRNA-dihydrouridine synthase
MNSIFNAKTKLLLAPMATLSHEALRRAVRYFGGCDEYYTEMIHAPSLLAGGVFEKYYLRQGPEPQKIVWQLTGSDAPRLAAAAKIVGALGGAGVDINMGCCAPAIWKTGAGIAWMQKPLEETAYMIRAVRRALDSLGGRARLSAKIRLGGDDFTDESFFAFCGMLVKEGVERITLHPRTKGEKYSRAPRWDYARRLVQWAKTHSAPVGLVLNGCVSGAQTLEAALRAAGNAEGVMIGRAAVQKPWVFAELCGDLKRGAPIDLLETALRFLSDLEECQPPEFWKSRRNRFFEFFCLNARYAHYLRTRLLNCHDNDSCRAALTEYFALTPEERFVSCSEDRTAVKFKSMTCNA